MDKLGRWTSPLDMAEGAGKGLQYVRGGLAHGDARAAFFLESPDAPVVRRPPRCARATALHISE